MDADAGSTANAVPGQEADRAPTVRVTCTHRIPARGGSAAVDRRCAQSPESNGSEPIGCGARVVEYDINDASLAPPERRRAEAWLRAHDPVHRDEKNGFWLLLRHADVREVSRRPERFSSEPHGPYLFDSQFAMVALDGAPHLRTRGSISRGFTPRRVAELESRARRYADEAIDALGPRERFDFVSALAVPVPLRIIADLIGIESGDLALFRRWSDLLVASVGEPVRVAGDLARVSGEFRAYLEQVVAQRRREPRDDLISVLLAARAEGLLASFGSSPIAGIEGDELTGFVQFLVLAGNETTRNVLSAGMLALLRHPEQRERLRREPALLPSAVEEILRYTSIVRGLRRTALRETELGGRRIRAGDSVVMVYPSANRDEAVFDAPDEFRIDRHPSEHLVFGIGPHFCLGASLARMQLRVLLERILARLPELALDPDEPPVEGRNPGLETIEQMSVLRAAQS